MRRYWIESKDRVGDLIVFKGDLFHHIFDVCRQEQGSKFEVLSEDGKAAFVEVIQVGKKSAEARVIEERVIPPLRQPWIHIVLAVPRFPVMEAVLEKMVEMGVKSVTPVLSEFSFVRTAAALSENKVERWERIITSATQQCGRGERMELKPTIKLDEALEAFNRNAGARGLFAYEGPSVLGLKEELGRWRKASPQPPADVTLFIGSEGGFSTEECRRFDSLGLSPVTLGSQILRVETACMALVSALKYEFDLMS